MAWNLAAFLTISTLKAEANLERIADYCNMGCQVFKGGMQNSKYVIIASAKLNLFLDKKYILAPFDNSALHLLAK